MENSYYDMLAETRASIEETLAKMLFVKKEGRNHGELRELSTEASVALLNLRQINRIILQDEDRVKQETEAAKLPVDYLTIQLNNLLYQKSHYLKAINACKDYKSKYSEIDLIFDGEFYKDAPKGFIRDGAQQLNPHKRMLERLSYELFKRKEMCKQQEVLEAKKKMLQEDLANKKRFLSSLPSHLKALKKASLPVQQQLGIQSTKHLKQHQLAELLPVPLFILYTQILDQKETFNENIELEIVGSSKDAQAVAYQQAMGNSDNTNGTLEERESDDKLEGGKDESHDRRKKAKRSGLKESLEHDDVYCKHPLSVLWHIHNELTDGGQKGIKLLTLRFDYLMKLKVVCAGIEEPPSRHELLMQLFPDDTGLTLPTQVAKLTAGVDFQYDVNRSSHPYEWAQHLAGVKFLSEVPPERISDNSKTSFHHGLTANRQEHRVRIILEKLRSQSIAQEAFK